MLFVSLAIAPLAFLEMADAHGPPPGGCAMYHGLEYESEIASFIVDNGEQQYDPLANPGVIIPVTRDQQFSVEFVLNSDALGFRMENGSRIEANSSDENGYAWYRDFANGYPFSKCAGPLQGETDFEISEEYPVSHMFQGEGPHLVFFETTLDDSRPRAEFYLQIVDEVAETETEQVEDEELPVDDTIDDEVDTALDPFLSQSDLTESASEESEDIGDMLTINGTVASLAMPSAENETIGSLQVPRIVAGNWFMTVNDTAVSDFQANITVVSADGSERENYLITDFTPVDSSAVQFDSNVIIVASATSIVSDDGEEPANLVVTLERLNAVRLDLDMPVGGNVAEPIYGIVDKLVISEDGQETEVITR
jgi:hypothetical protein